MSDPRRGVKWSSLHYTNWRWRQYQSPEIFRLRSFREDLVPGLLSRSRTTLAFSALLVALHPVAPPAQSDAGAPRSTALHPRDGQHDFDFEIGTWRTRLARLERPLSGSTTWVEYEGTSVVRKVWNGGANLVELDVRGPAGRLEGLSLRLYNPETRQWSLNFSNRRSGTLTTPVIGEFRNGRGEFYAQESFNGRAVFVRFVITVFTPDSARFEQSFSDDGGSTWEPNWIAVDTRIREVLQHAR